MFIARTRIMALALPMALALLAAGCGGKKTAELPAQNLTPPQRPEALKTAADQIRAGQGAAAEQTATAWLAQHKGDPFEAEGHYLAGQAQFAQGKYQAAKESQDFAVDLAPERTTKALAMLARADCNFQMGNYHLASRQYHWLEELYRDVTAVPNDEVLFKLGMSAKMAGFPETADYWFDKVVELHATGTYAAEARRQHSKLGPAESGEPTYYTLELASFGDESKALAEAETYRQKGYRDVQVQKTSMLGTTYYAIHVGKYFNKLDANQAKEDAELAGLNPAIRPGVINVPK